MNTELYPFQIEAMKKMHNGCILGGKVGAGKSRTALAYIYICELGGSLRINNIGTYAKPETPKDIYIITTAKKRDSLEWEEEVAYFCLPSSVNVTIDSWNNLHKYTKVYGAMFIFDEQRTTSGKKWAKEFIKISRRNHWVMLSATPGDKYIELWPVLVANGFYQNKSQFEMEHCVFKPFLKYKDIDRYVGTKRLDSYISQIIVPMNYEHDIIKNKYPIICDYDKTLYKRVMKDRWDPYEDCPIEEVSKLCSLLRRVTNSDESRARALMEILSKHYSAIIFYNFNYELEIIKNVCDNLCIRYSEWNGHKHEPILKDGNTGWVYICQYTACSEGWNCITTNTMIFFSQNYSYKTLAQAEGRIDRNNTPFKELNYYYLRSKSPMDLAITRAINEKRIFTDNMFLRGVAVNGKGNKLGT